MISIKKDWINTGLDVDVSILPQGDIDSMILEALNRTNVTMLDWRFVAARLRLLKIYKECDETLPTEGYKDFVYKMLELGIYDCALGEHFTEDDFSKVEKYINHDYDLGFDYAGVNLLGNRYLMRRGDKLVEKPQYMFMTLAMMLAIPEKDKEHRLKFIKDTYTMLAQRKISLATPLVLNLRRPGGNLASCFITKMDDSLDSIYHTLTQCAQISKNAGGVGVNMASVRAKGAKIKHVKNASGGIVPWIKLVNDTAVAVNQLGSRSGAITVAVESWHLDIYSFLELQTENGDYRTKAHDIFPQIVVSDLFMYRVQEDDDWTLFDPYEVKRKMGYDLATLYGVDFLGAYTECEQSDVLKLRKTVKARALFKQILRTIVETGMPYIFFKDTVNEANPNDHAGMIGNANLCTESFSNFGEGYVHTCNLLSLNLAELDINEAQRAAELGVNILDNAIDLTEPPIPESKKHNDDYRILGIGLMGLADYLVKKKLTYENCDDELHTLMDAIQFAAVQSSMTLALRRGAYPKFKGSKWERGLFGGLDDSWDKLREMVAKHGMRNGGLFAIAPTTSTSLLMGATASILPPYSKFYIDKASNGAVPIVPPFLKGNMFMYRENKHVDQRYIVHVTSILQRYVDQGISMELLVNMQNGFTAKDLYDLYMLAWDKKLKTVYYVRSITEKQAKEDCVSCSG